jgi:hypothetical protein
MCVAVSDKQHSELNLPRSIANMIMILLRALGVKTVTRATSIAPDHAA